MTTMTSRHLAALTVGLLMSAAVGESQQQDHQHEAAAPDQALVAACAQAQLPLAQTLAAAESRLERARQSNEPAAMRAAIGDFQQVLLDIRSLVAPCGRLSGATDPHAAHR